MEVKPFALHFTWTTYGTWLPGDPRGSTSPTFLSHQPYTQRFNTPGTDYARADAFTQHKSKALQKDPVVWLTTEMARIVAECVIETAKSNLWQCSRGAIMSNHVHFLLMEVPTDPSPTRRMLKGVSQARLTQETGQSRRWWTTGGSDRFKNDWEAIEAAQNYIMEQERPLVLIKDMEIVLIRYYSA